MELDIRIKILIAITLFSIFISAQTKPVVGKVVSDANIYLSDVAITSLPSLSMTKTDSSGFFSFNVPIKDRKIIFELDGYLSDTLNVILLINNEDIQLIELVEIDYLDSVDTSIKFNVFNKEANVYEYDMLDMLFLGLSKMGSLVNMDNAIFTEKNMDGSMKFFINGISNANYNYFYNNVRLNHIDDCIINLTPISEMGLSKLVINNGGFNKLSAISELVDFLPNNTYKNQFNFGLSQGTQESNTIDAYGAVGIKFANINGGMYLKENNTNYSDSTLNENKTISENYFSNIVFKNLKNFESTFSVFQNNRIFSNPNNSDTLNIDKINFISKIDQWTPFLGKISLFGSYQDKNGVNFNQLDSIQISDKSRSLGFLLEKDIKNQLFTISASSILINSNWNLTNNSAIIDRQNYILTGSANLFFDYKIGDFLIKHIKMVYGKERTTDVMAINSIVQIPPNYWDDESYLFKTAIIKQNDDRKTLLYAGYGISSKTPYLQDIIKYHAYSIFYDSTKVIYPEEKYSLNTKFSHENKLKSTGGHYIFSVRYFNHQFENKFNTIPLIGNIMTLPFNVGDARVSGVNIGLEFQPYTNNLRLKSDIVFHELSDRLKFQSFPLKAIKNQILFKYKSFNFNFKSTTKSERYFAFINALNQIVYSKMKPVTVYDIQLSKSFSYKFINLIISGNVDNLNDSNIFVGGIKTNNRKYNLELSLLIH